MNDNNNNEALSLYQQYFDNQATNLAALSQKQYNNLVDLTALNPLERNKLLIGFEEQHPKNIVALLDADENQKAQAITYYNNTRSACTPSALFLRDFISELMLEIAASENFKQRTENSHKSILQAWVDYLANYPEYNDADELAKLPQAVQDNIHYILAQPSIQAIQKLQDAIELHAKLLSEQYSQYTKQDAAGDDLMPIYVLQFNANAKLKQLDLYALSECLLNPESSVRYAFTSLIGGITYDATINTHNLLTVNELANAGELEKFALKQTLAKISLPQLEKLANKLPDECAPWMKAEIYTARLEKLEQHITKVVILDIDQQQESLDKRAMTVSLFSSRIDRIICKKKSQELEELKDELGTTAKKIKNELSGMSTDELAANGQYVYASKIQECHAHFDAYLDVKKGAAEKWVNSHSSLATQVYIFMAGVCSKLKRGLVALTGQEPMLAIERTTATHDHLQKVKSELPGISAC